MQRGFTIIELVVTISLIAILTGIGVVAASQVQKDSRDAKRQSDIAVIQSELEKFYDKNSEYPAGCRLYCSSWFFTDNVSSGGALITSTATTADIKNPYLPGLPDGLNDPSNQTNTPFNAVNRYFYFGGTVNTRASGQSSISDATPGPVTCGFSQTLQAKQTSSYVLGYFSEIKQQWILSFGKRGIKPTFTTTANTNCVIAS